MTQGAAQQHDLPGVIEVVLGEPDELREGRIRRIRDERVVEVRGRKRRDYLAQSLVEREERFDVTAHDGLTVIVSTHDLDLALSHADRIWLVAAGTVTDNAPEQLVGGPALARAFLPEDHGAEHAASFEAVVTALHRSMQRGVRKAAT